MKTTFHWTFLILLLLIIRSGEVMAQPCFSHGSDTQYSVLRALDASPMSASRDSSSFAAVKCMPLAVNPTSREDSNFVIFLETGHVCSVVSRNTKLIGRRDILLQSIRSRPKVVGFEYIDEGILRQISRLGEFITDSACSFIRTDTVASEQHMWLLNFSEPTNSGFLLQASGETIPVRILVGLQTSSIDAFFSWEVREYLENVEILSIEALGPRGAAFITPSERKIVVWDSLGVELAEVVYCSDEQIEKKIMSAREALDGASVSLPSDIDSALSEAFALPAENGFDSLAILSCKD